MSNLGISAITALIAAVIVLVGDIQRPGRAAATAIGTFFIAFVANIIAIELFKPTFLYWGNSVVFFAIAAVIGLCVSGLFNLDTSDSDRTYGWALMLVVLIGVFIVAPFYQVFFEHPTLQIAGLVCDNNGYKELAKQLKVTEHTSGSFDNSELTNFVRVPETVAKQKVDNILSQDGLSTYLGVSRAAYQIYKGHPVYVVSLKARNAYSLNTFGGVIPGYYIVDAMDNAVPPQFMKGYQIKLTPDYVAADLFSAFDDRNLDRFVYFHIALPTGLTLDDYTTLEIDETGKPYYTGTLVKPAMGWRGLTPVSLVTIDAQTSEIKQYPIDQIASTPEVSWVDRIWSEDLILEQVKWWGEYANHDDCPLSGTANQHKLDADEDVFIRGKLYRQITMTSKEADKSLSKVMYIDQRTGLADVYPGQGPTLSAVKDMYRNQSTSQNAKGYEPQDCAMQIVTGREVWYCIMLGVDKNTGATVAEIRGYGMFQVQYAAQQQSSMALFDSTLQGVYDQLLNQIQRGGDIAAIGKTADDVVIKGTIDRIASMSLKDGTTQISFTLSGAQLITAQGTTPVPSTVIFVVIADDRTVLLRSGDAVIVYAIAPKVNPGDKNFVKSVVSILDAPTATPSLQTPAATQPAK